MAVSIKTVLRAEKLQVLDAIIWREVGQQIAWPKCQSSRLAASASIY